MKLNTVKILGILFKISFLPYIVLILLAIYTSIFGFTFLFTTSYGLDAFLSTIILFGTLGCIYFPIFPVVFNYEIIYLIWRKIGKKHHT